MSLSIYTAHNGGVLKADGNSFTTLEELKEWIERQIRLSRECQILMTPLGGKAMLKSLSQERELFLYNREQITASAKPLLEPIPKEPHITPFPDDLDNETDMASWRRLFTKRKQWAEDVQQRLVGLVDKIREVDSQTAIMQRAVVVAFTNLDNHTNTLKDRWAAVQQVTGNLIDDRHGWLKGWETAVKQLLRIPVHEEFKKCGSNEKVNRKITVLADFFDIKEVQIAATTAEILMPRLLNDMEMMKSSVRDIAARTAALKNSIDNQDTRIDVEGELGGLLQEVDILLGKIQTDHDYVRNLQGPKAAAMASKRAYAATAEYLPGLKSAAIDIGKLYVAVCERKNAASVTCQEHLTNLAFIQVMFGPVNTVINKVEKDTEGREDANFELLHLVILLPISYGSLLIECVRRREWSEKFNTNSSKMAEDLSVLKEDEERRRKNWRKHTAMLLPFDVDNNSQTSRAEVSIRGDPTGGLPKISRQDVEAYIAVLQQVGGLDSAIKTITQHYEDMDKPSKRVNKRLQKAFKMGSIHEAGMMESSIMIPRNDDEVKSLKADKEQLHERIRGYESRIRKLEDLLHRNRTAAAISGNYPASMATSPPPGRPSTPSAFSSSPSKPTMQAPSIPHRRSSSEAQNSETHYKAKSLALEAELRIMQEKMERLQAQVSGNNESEKVMNARITQTEQTKRDLIENLQSTVKSNNEERKQLTMEITMLKEKLEQAEDELEKLEEERIKPLESEQDLMKTELSILRNQHNAEVEEKTELQQKLLIMEKEKDEEIARLRAELQMQTSKAEQGFRRTSEAEAANNELSKQLHEAKSALDSRTNIHTSMLDTMKAALGYLTPDPAPEDMHVLMDQLEALVSKATARNKHLNALLNTSKSLVESLNKEKDFLQKRFDSRTMKAKDLTQRLYTHNVRSIQLLESLGFKIVRNDGNMQIVKVSRSSSKTAAAGGVGESTDLSLTLNAVPSSPEDAARARKSPLSQDPETSSPADDLALLYWMESPDSDIESEKYSLFLGTIGSFDLDAFSDSIISRVKKTDHDFRSALKQARTYREKYYRARDEASEKIAFKSFKTGDLALFLPTRNQVTRPWAAFNVGAPHFFLREQDTHKLGARDWLLARITRVEEKVVDLSKRSTNSGLITNPASEAGSAKSVTGDEKEVDEDNPFELSDGLRWFMLDAVEEKAGAPTTPGLSSSTVAAANVDARGSIKKQKPVTGAKKKLSEVAGEASRRSSTGSRGSFEVGSILPAGGVAQTHAAEGEIQPPRTPVEKIAAGIRSRAGSIRSVSSFTGRA
ncbi:autophagy-related protein 11-domain-containing protein [Pyronema domesticum]|nr:autophagy-related protein 11-domain-containing protein [Pyronema domesticum]